MWVSNYVLLCFFALQSSTKHVGAAPADDPGHGHRKQGGSGGVLQPLPVHSGGQRSLHHTAQLFVAALLDFLRNKTVSYKIVSTQQTAKYLQFVDYIVKTSRFCLIIRLYAVVSICKTFMKYLGWSFVLTCVVL